MRFVIGLQVTLTKDFLFAIKGSHYVSHIRSTKDAFSDAFVLCMVNIELFCDCSVIESIAREWNIFHTDVLLSKKI